MRTHPVIVWLMCVALSACSNGSSSHVKAADQIDAAVGGTSHADAAADQVDAAVGGACDGDQDPANLHVRTESGTVIGKRSGDSDAFLGIPYVAPPVGVRRWAEPAPAGCFAQPLDATRLGARCPQLDDDKTTVIGQEDCLTLNVWAKTARSAALPVLLFIHGGGHAIGGSDDPLYDGAKLAAWGSGAVVITINYRLGALGYLAHAGIPANLGLRDQLAAVSWVRRNVQAFGGDPEHITLFGESAGGESVCTLLGTPSADGLFERAVVESGGCRQPSAAVYMPRNDQYFTHTGCSGQADELACLRALDVTTIVTTEPTGYPNVAALAQGWAPYVDGTLLPRSTEARWTAGEQGGAVAVIIGSNRDETAASVPTALTAAQYEALVRASIPKLVVDSVLAEYPVSDYASPTAAYIALTSEAKFICGARRAANAAAQTGLQSRLYMFSFDDYTAFGRPQRVTHGLELAYLFGNFSGIKIGMLAYTPNAADLAMSQEMMQRWISFATDGTASAAPAASWPTLPTGYLVLDQPSVLGTTEYPAAHCDFWDGLL